MEPFPFFRRPYYYYNMGNRYNHINNSQKIQYQEEIQKKQEVKKEQEKSEYSEVRHVGEEPIFEIFGIKLFFDDILIVALIFFLYNEGVEDNLLFISLILLLLS